MYHVIAEICQWSQQKNVKKAGCGTIVIVCSVQIIESMFLKTKEFTLFRIESQVFKARKNIVIERLNIVWRDFKKWFVRRDVLVFIFLLIIHCYSFLTFASSPLDTNLSSDCKFLDKLKSFSFCGIVKTAAILTRNIF